MSIETKEILDQAFTRQTAVILKHSTRCPVSAAAKREFETFAANYHDMDGLYIVDVIQQRHISQAIAEQTGIRHESPQLLIVRSGTVVWNASHWSITKEAIQKELKKNDTRQG